MPLRPALLAAALLLAAGPALAETHVVDQANKKFSATELAVKAGDTVRFVNKDSITHNVYSQSPGNAFDVKTQKPGESSDVVLKSAGEVEVRCAIHPTMKLKVTVKD